MGKTYHSSARRCSFLKRQASPLTQLITIVPNLSFPLLFRIGFADFDHNIESNLANMSTVTQPDISH